MAKTGIAGALLLVVLAGCSEQSPRVLRPSGADQAEAQKTPVETAKNSAAENAGLRADFQAP